MDNNVNRHLSISATGRNRDDQSCQDRHRAARLVQRQNVLPRAGHQGGAAAAWADVCHGHRQVRPPVSAAAVPAAEGTAGH